MLPRIFARTGTIATLVAILALSVFATSCGGGSGYAAKDMILVELQFLDRSLSPTAPTGTTSLPRNAIIGLVFSEVVNPGSVNNQTVQLRFGASFQSVPDGSFQISGNRVLFDPTTTAQVTGKLAHQGHLFGDDGLLAAGQRCGKQSGAGSLF